MEKKYDFIFDDASNIFFSSDSHFWHENILKFCHRPFKDVDEMNRALIDNWNKKANDDSIIFHLGDFAWGGYEKWKEIREQLKGHIVLIKGNHDEKNLSSTSKELFDYVTYQMRLRIEGRVVYLNHFPFLCYSGTYRKPEDVPYALFGHVHGGPLSQDGSDIPRMKYLFPSQYDVGVDNNNFEPVSWYEVDAKIKAQMAIASLNEKWKK